jgi:hypothetical protein
MPVIDKSSNLFEATERITNVIKGKRNLTSQDTATIALYTVLNSLADSGMDASAALEIITPNATEEEKARAMKAQAWRKSIRDEIKPLLTAAKNYQSSYCEPTGLMPKPSAGEAVEEFV